MRVIFLVCVALLTALGCSTSRDEDTGAPPPLTSRPAEEVTPAPLPSDAAATVEPPPPVPPPWTPPIVPTTSPACADASSPPMIADGTTLDAGGRTFHLWKRGGYDRTKTWPVVLVFHGIQTTGRDFQSWFRMEDYVDDEAIVVYPDAENGYWDPQGDKDLVFFDTMMKKLGERYCIDPSKVLGFGFSWGAYFAHHLGCKRAGWVKAISGGAGGAYGASSCGRLPVLVTHRTADPDERVANGRQATAMWTKLAGCTGGEVISNVEMNCLSRGDCVAPGAVTFCEDTFFDATWPATWNHTVRESYRAFTWRWFAALP